MGLVGHREVEKGLPLPPWLRGEWGNCPQVTLIFMFLMAPDETSGSLAFLKKLRYN